MEHSCMKIDFISEGREIVLFQQSSMTAMQTMSLSLLSLSPKCVQRQTFPFNTCSQCCVVNLGEAGK